jgi:hypothetical protein
MVEVFGQGKGRGLGGGSGRVRRGCGRSVRVKSGVVDRRGLGGGGYGMLG